MKNEVIPVFLTIDDGFAKYTSVMIRSIIGNAAPQDHYKIWIIHRGLSDENQQKLEGMATANVEVETHFLKADLSRIANREENYLRLDFFTLSIFYRLFLADEFPEYDKAIYLDCDAVVPGNLADLYRIDLGNNLIGAAPDHSIWHVPGMIKYIEGALGIPYKTYINSGVLLINMKAFREEHFTEHFLNVMNKHYFACIAPDQDYLNMICRDRILYLDETWNAMPKDHQYDAEKLTAPQLVHYNLFYKPWHFDNVMYESYFWKYADATPYAQEIHAEKDNFTDEQRRGEVEKLDKLMERAAALPATEGTFKKVIAQGERIKLC